MANSKNVALRLVAGACLYAAIAATFTFTVHDRVPALVYLVSGSVFALSFKIAGESLRFTPLRGLSSVLSSYLLSAFGMALSVYALWLAFQFTAQSSSA